MNLKNIAIVVVLLAAVAGVVAIKQNKTSAPATNVTAPRPAEVNSKPEPKPVAALPRLVDLGADKCLPCKMMAPILEELKKEYAGALNVEFIDVWKNPDAGSKYGISIIPTQIFYDVSGKELFRHEGFFSKEDILAKWKELGIELKKK
jgi:thioredoxin 1